MLAGQLNQILLVFLNIYSLFKQAHDSLNFIQNLFWWIVHSLVIIREVFTLTPSALISLWMFFLTHPNEWIDDESMSEHCLESGYIGVGNFPRPSSCTNVQPDTSLEGGPPLGSVKPTCKLLKLCGWTQFVVNMSFDMSKVFCLSIFLKKLSYI